MPRIGSVAALVLCACATACGGASVGGQYVGRGETFFDSLTFRSDGKVEIVFVGGRHEGGYVVDGDKVTITAPNGQQSLLTVGSDGCLTHSLLGTYCKGGISAASTAATSAANAPAPRSAAQVYEGNASEGRITLEFDGARTARITMTPSRASDAPERMSFDVPYAMNGDQITVNLPGGGERLMLTRDGTDLEGTLNGETVRFVKR